MTDQPKPFSISLPSRSGHGIERIETPQSIIVIGANGSGKTRLGSWIELQSEQEGFIHRISAQKSLRMPEAVSTSRLKEAENTLLIGQSKLTGSVVYTKSGNRWGSDPDIHPLDDFQILMMYLFTEESEKSIEYRRQSSISEYRVDPPQTKLDIIRKIWKAIHPHRSLIIKSGTIETKIEGATDYTYNASKMSDGERVSFYLIGQCLAAPENGIIIIDEPELHIHKSIQSKLWQMIESERSDCAFIYLTHDINFATSKFDAVKIWLKSYDGARWEWEIISPSDDLPEDLTLEILGNRRSVIFVEGENGSHDIALFQLMYVDSLIIPRGSCSQVIISTKAFRTSPLLHHLNIHGIIDRDRRVEGEISLLKKDDISVLKVAEMENLFCTPEVLRVLCENLHHDFNVKYEEITNFVFDRLRSEINLQSSLHTISEIKHRLNLLSDKSKSASEIKSDLDALVTGIDVQAIFSDCEQTLQKALDDQDYVAVLRLYNRKSLASQIAPILGLKGEALIEYVLRILKGPDSQPMRKALMAYLPPMQPALAHVDPESHSGSSHTI